MSLARTLVPEESPRVAIHLDELARSRLKEAWELVATHGEDAILTDRIRKAADAVVNNQIAIAFGGHWSAGKTTLINALLGRDLLPVSERTETGVACRIRSGTADEARSMRGYGSIAIPCTKEAIADQVSITAGGAEPRSELAVVEAIELTLADTPLLPNVCWVDTPGLNDAPDAEDRLRREVDRADQLLWVLNPDQFLSEVEQMFLADHVARRGVASVTLLVNVRTHQDVASDWRRFHDEGWLAHSAKIEHFWDAAGIAESSRPPVLIVSGAHLREEFGSKNLIDFLSGAGGALGRRVVSARVATLTVVVADVLFEIERRTREQQRRAEQQRQAQADQERRLATFRSAATADILEIVADVRESLRAIGAQLAGACSSSSAQSEGAMAARLRSEMYRLFLARWNDVVICLGNAAARATIDAPTSEAIGAVATHLAVPAVVIPPPAVAPSGGCANGCGCAAPLTLLLLLLSSRAARQRARDLPRRVDDAILAATAAHAAQVFVAVDRAIAVYTEPRL